MRENMEMFNNSLNLINNLCEVYEKEQQANIWNLNYGIGEHLLKILCMVVFVFADST